MTRERSVRQWLLTLVLVATVLILLVGVAGTLSVFFSTKAVDQLRGKVNPAVNANAAFYEDMLTAQASVRAYAISGTRDELAAYAVAVDRLESDGRPLEAYGDRNAAVRELFRAERAAAQKWIHGYAIQRVADGGGPGTYRAPLFQKGQRLFREITAAHDRLANRLDSEYDVAQDDARTRLRATVGLIAAAAVIGGLSIALLGMWITEHVRRPLAALERVVARLTAGEYGARVRVDGPREIRRVSNALNELADESERGREVESAIQAQLREIDSAKSDFVSNVSHELRTPLTIITGYLELLEEELAGELEEEQARMLEVTGRNVHRLRDLIEDLLTLDKAEHSGTAMEQIDLCATVQAVASDLRLSASNRSVTVDVDCPGAPVVALADGSQLHRAVLNLVSNAVKFSRPGGVVRLRLRLPGPDAVLEVIDQGIGIPKTELPKLGARFFRASNAVQSEIGGTGLGLRIVQTIVMNHHGTLTLDSVEGEGTTVRVVLPLRPPMHDGDNGVG